MINPKPLTLLPRGPYKKNLLPPPSGPPTSYMSPSGMLEARRRAIMSGWGALPAPDHQLCASPSTTIMSCGQGGGAGHAGFCRAALKKPWKPWKKTPGYPNPAPHLRDGVPLLHHLDLGSNNGQACAQRW